MPLPQKLNKFSTASPVIGSYSWKEIAEGTGIIDYYVHQVGNAGSVTYKLLTTAQQDWEGATENHYSNVENLTVTFTSLAFNTSRIMEGTAYITFYQVVHPTSTAGTGSGKVTISIKKNAVEIATVDSETRTLAANWNANGGVDFLTVAIPRTKFNIGDVITITATGTTSGACDHDITHEPLNGDVTIPAHASAGGPFTISAGTPTYFKTSLPFRTDIE